MTETQTKVDATDATDARNASVLDGVTAKPGTTPKRTPRPKPAAKATPKPKPTPKAAPKPTVTAAPKATMAAAKQELVRIALQAMADAVGRANGLKKTSYLAVIDPDEAKQILSQMTHHFPTGRDESGARWWPASLPKPDRSDWR